MKYYSFERYDGVCYPHYKSLLSIIVRLFTAIKIQEFYLVSLNILSHQTGEYLQFCFSAGKGRLCERQCRVLVNGFAKAGTMVFTCHCQGSIGHHK